MLAWEVHFLVSSAGQAYDAARWGPGLGGTSGARAGHTEKSPRRLGETA